MEQSPISIIDNHTTISSTIPAAIAKDPVTVKTHASELPAGSEIVKLRIRTESKQFVLTLLPSDTLPVVYKYVKQNVANHLNKHLELFTSFPKKSYPESMAGSLKDLGLVPSCALNVKLS